MPLSGRRRPSTAWKSSTELEALLTRSAAELAAEAAQVQWHYQGLPEEAVEAYQHALETRLEVSEAWSELRGGAAELQDLAREAVNAARDALRGAQASWQAVHAQLEHLRQHSEIDPPLPPDRAAALHLLEQAGIAATPFYAAVRPQNGQPDLGKLEAALLISGVLSALVVAQAQQPQALALLQANGLSEALLQSSEISSPIVPNLSQVLLPEDALSAEVQASVAAALAGIGLEISPNHLASAVSLSAVSISGEWQSGVLVGSADGPGSRFLGYAARAAERERQLQRLEAEEADLSAQVSALSEQLSQHSAAEQILHNQLAQLRDAPQQMPQRREQHSRRERAREALAGRAQAQETAQTALQVAQQQASGARQILQAAFEPLRLETPTPERTPAALTNTELTSPEQTNAEQMALEWARQDARQAESQQREQLALNLSLVQHQRDAEESAERASDSRSEISRLDAERLPLEAQRSSLQATVSELMSQHSAPDAAELRSRLRQQRQLLSEVTREHAALARSLAAAQERLKVTSERLPELRGSRDEAANAHTLTAQHLAQLLARHPHLSEQLAQQPPTGPLAELEAERQRRTDSLRDQYELRRRTLETPDSYRPAFGGEGPRFVLDGQLISPDALLSHLVAELETAQKLLTEEEARVFHNELIRLLVEELDRKQRDAATWVSSVRRTLAGLRFHEERLDLERHSAPSSGLPGERLAAQIDGRIDPVHQPETWWAQVQISVRDLVRELQAAQSPETSFAQALERALDYRQWLTFRFISVLPGVQGGPERRREITDRTFAQRSGGERSAVLYTFLFAALGARFDLLGPSVPRLIGLDEAFAGMDLPNISALYGVLTDLDLSWIATSERRIDLSRALPAAATYQLFRVASRSGDGVSSLSYLWDGQTQHDGRLAGIAGE